jgi:plastocyanin
MVFRLLVLPVLILGSALLLACDDDDNGGQENGNGQTENGQTDNGQTEDVTPGAQTQEPSDILELEMTIEDFSYSPESIDAAAGTQIFVELANDGEQEHTFTIEELSIDEALQSGEDLDVTIIPDEEGEYTIFCRNHDGMTATLNVTPAGETSQQSDSDSGGGGYGAGY